MKVTCVFCYDRFTLDGDELFIEGGLKLCESCASLAVGLRNRSATGQDELPGRTLIPDFERSPRLRRLKAHYPFDRRQFSEDLETCRRRAKGELSRAHYNEQFLALYLRLFAMGYNLLELVDANVGPDWAWTKDSTPIGACGDDHETGSRMDDCFACVSAALYELGSKMLRWGQWPDGQSIKDFDADVLAAIPAELKPIVGVACRVTAASRIERLDTIYRELWADVKVWMAKADHHDGCLIQSGDVECECGLILLRLGMAAAATPNALVEPKAQHEDPERPTDQADARRKAGSFPDDDEICQCGHRWGDHVGIGCGQCDKCKGYSTATPCQAFEPQRPKFPPNLVVHEACGGSWDDGSPENHTWWCRLISKVLR